jgi:dissimilatory sulfite reductase (desulfoviridin) alpha/beta subunit
MERHKFNTAVQGGQSFQEFLADLKIKASTCWFGELKDEMICDRLVCGITNNAVRKLLLRENDLTLTKAIHICEVNELSDRRIKELSTQKDPCRRYMRCERKIEETLSGEKQVKRNSTAVIVVEYMPDNNARLK